MTTTGPRPVARDHVPDLLARPPTGTREFVTDWSHLLVDPIRQLAVLAELFESGLLSWAEYERYKRTIRDL